MKEHFNNFNFSIFWDNDEYSLKEYVGKPIIKSQIEEIETELHFKLPTSYIEFLQYQNGGIPFFNCHPTKSPTSWAEDHIQITGIFGIDKTKTYSLCGELGNKFWQTEWDYPDIGIYFCDCPSAGHDMVCLDYTDCGSLGEPKVVHIDQEFDYKITFLANNFEQFIQGLKKPKKL